MSDPDRIATKGEFAEICGVTAAAVSQWISTGKITPDALVGEGRSAKIRVELARRQVNLRRDIGQALGNGLTTKLAPGRPAATAHDAPDEGEDRYEGWSPEGTSDDVDRKLKLARLEAAERANRLAAVEEAASEGRYTDTAEARAEMGKIAGQVVRIFEGALPEIATAIAAEFKLDARDVTYQLNEQFRKAREQAAEAARKAAALLPETIETAPSGA